MILETERLLLRPWRLDDAFSLYQYAKDPSVGPIAGWPEHKNALESAEVIENVLSKPHIYAVCLRENNIAIGSIGLMLGKDGHAELDKDEAEIGYWIGLPFWGQGLIPEAVDEILRYAFEYLNMSRVWCSHFEENMNSKRVQEKCGFRHRYIVQNKDWPLLQVKNTMHYSCIEREEWLAQSLFRHE